MYHSLVVLKVGIGTPLGAAILESGIGHRYLGMGHNTFLDVSLTEYNGTFLDITNGGLGQTVILRSGSGAEMLKNHSQTLQSRVTRGRRKRHLL